MPERDGDPRAAAALTAPLRAEGAVATGMRAIMTHRTASSGLWLSAAMGHVIDGPAGVDCSAEAFDDLARLTVSVDVSPGRPLRLVKFLAYGWSGERSVPALRDQVGGALSEAQHRGWDRLLAEQRAYLDAFWEHADVELDGDAELQQAIRFALFHALQAGARAERRAIAAKGLTGAGYDGHAFWDTETFVLQLLTYTAPQAACDALRWRHSTLDLARARAQQLGLRGAAFPWRTIRGQECSGYWPAGTAAFHVNADIADAVIRYQGATEDPQFEIEVGTELLVETARLWRSLGHHDAAGHFRIDGVTGPDEYTAIHDNNIYTNLMAQQNLRAAADAVARHSEVATRLGVDPEEAASWRDAAETIVVPYDWERRVHAQADGFTQHDRWSFEHTLPDQYPLLLHFPYFDLYRKQVVKQADLVLAMHLCGDAFDAEQKARNFAYYEAVTVRDSSLSACTQAVLAAEVGHLELAYDYLAEAALLDLDDLDHNTRDGLHIASLAGAWIAAVAGFGGLRDHAGTLSFAPRLPQALGRLKFGISYRGRRLQVEIRHDRARYTLTEGEQLEIRHHGVRATVKRGRPLSRQISPASVRETPTQPPGRAPARRRPRE
jgi:alpha,alpha-trehalose phosphorylase